MEVLVPISRLEINLICDSIDPIPALDELSSSMATKVFKERLRKQLTGKMWKGGRQAMDAILAYVSKRSNLSRIPDYTFVGLQSSEALSKEIAQASQDAFKVVVKTMVISAMVDSMKNITETVRDRKDPKCIVHFDKSYSKMGNFTLQEAIAMRSVFVSTTMQQLYKGGGPVTGILEEFNGDGVSPDLRKLRQKCSERYSTRVLPHGVWNKLAVALPSGRQFSTCVLVLRFYLDSAAMYARNIGMHDAVRAFTETLKPFRADYKFSFAASSLEDAIIDVCVGAPDGINTYSDEYMNKFDAELLALDKIAKPNIGGYTTGGLQGVVDMTINRVDLTRFLDAQKPHEHVLASHGRDMWAKDNDIRDEDVDSHIVVVDPHQADGYKTIYADGSDAYIYSPEGGGDKPDSDGLDSAYIRYFLEGFNDVNLDTLWLLTLDIVAMRRVCITWDDEIKPMLAYCGIHVLKVFNHELVDLPYYIYVYSEDKPMDVISSVVGAMMLPYDQLPNIARNWFRDWSDVIGSSDEFEDNQASFYERHREEITQRVSKYTYATLALTRKGTTKTKKYAKYIDVTPYEWHVLPHAYQRIINMPFVERNRTYTNDWYTNTYVLGADCARNIYTDEFYMLASEQSNTDPRHMELFCDVAFSKGYPVGCGQRGVDGHSKGALTQMGTVQQKKQLGIVFNTEEEGIDSTDVATYYGAPPIGLETKERQVTYNIRAQQAEQELIELRLGTRFAPLVSNLSSFASHEQTTTIAVLSMYMDADPFKGFATDDLVIFPNVDHGMDVSEDIIKADEFIARVLSGKEAKIKYLSSLASYRTRRFIAKLPDNSSIIDLGELYNFMVVNPFVLPAIFNDEDAK